MSKLVFRFINQKPFEDEKNTKNLFGFCFVSIILLGVLGVLSNNKSGFIESIREEEKINRKKTVAFFGSGTTSQHHQFLNSNKT